VPLGYNNTLNVSQNRVDKKCTDGYTIREQVDIIIHDEQREKEIGGTARGD
jgi:hypothetical protein